MPHLHTLAIFEFALALVLILSMWIALELGRRIGIRAKLGGTEVAQLGTMQGAILGMLALLLGLSFSGATSRFVDRQDVLVREANAISTAYLRADLLPPTHAESVRFHLRAYAAARLELFESISEHRSVEINQRLATIQSSLWSAAVQGVNESPSLTLIVIPPLNEVFDLLAVRNAATHRHLPALVLFLLFSSALAAMATVGYGLGLSKNRHRLAAAALCLLISVSLWTTIDLDFPRAGLIQISDAPLRAAIPPAPSR